MVRREVKRRTKGQRPHIRRSVKGKVFNAGKRFDFPLKRSPNRYHATVVVPSTTKKDKKISDSQFNKRVNETKNTINKMFGGSTTVIAKGSFTDNKGRLIEEKVAAVGTYANKKDYFKRDQDLKKFLKDKRKKWGQESIGFAFESPERPDEELHFI